MCIRAENMQPAVFADHGTLAKYRAKQSRGFQVKTAPAGTRVARPVTMRIFLLITLARGRPFSTKTNITYCALVRATSGRCVYLYAHGANVRNSVFSSPLRSIIIIIITYCTFYLYNIFVYAIRATVYLDNVTMLKR